VLAVVLYAINQSMHALNTRHGHFNLMGLSGLTRDLMASLSKLALGYFGVLKQGLILGYLFSQSLFLVLLSLPFLKHIARYRQGVEGNLTNLLVLAQKYIDFPKKALPSNAIAVLSIQAPILFLGVIFSPEVLGYYALARTVLGLPVTVLGGSIMSVFQNEASKQFNATGNCQSLYQRLGLTIFSLGIIPVVLGMLFVGPLFEMVFGPEWSTAGYYCAILMPLYLLRLIGKPLGYIFPLTKHLNFSLYIMLAFGFSSAGALGAGYLFNSPVLAVLLISISHSFCYLAMIYFGLQMSRGVKYAIK
jgi:O-antigen/teichoic acid export membrane protein